MSIPYTAAELDKTAFNCPFCQAFAKQEWFHVAKSYAPPHAGGTSGLVKGAKVAVCSHCGNASIWIGTTLIFPSRSSAPPPNPDMPEAVKKDYNEARSVLQPSPKSACALLRLGVQKLCSHLLGTESKDLNTAIGQLVKQGLPIKIQQALDSVRVIGNNAVHPGELSIDDNPEMANTLFGLVNIITQQMITGPKTIEAVYESLPESAKQQITDRDERK